MQNRSLEELQAGVDEVRRSPGGAGRVELIVRRPAIAEREVVIEAVLDLAEGVVGDNWRVKGSMRTADGSPHPQQQITLMNARAAALIAGPMERWPLAGDQFFVDLDLSVGGLPAGSRIALGDAVLEVSPLPHTGCAKFSARFGTDAMRFVNTAEGRALRLRGVNARVVVPGKVRTGSEVRCICLGAQMVQETTLPVRPVF